MSKISTILKYLGFILSAVITSIVLFIFVLYVVIPMPKIEIDKELGDQFCIINENDGLECKSIMRAIFEKVGEFQNDSTHIILRSYSEDYPDIYWIINIKNDKIEGPMNSKVLSAKCDSLHIQPNFVIE